MFLRKYCTGTVGEEGAVPVTASDQFFFCLLELRQSFRDYRVIGSMETDVKRSALVG